MILAMWLPMMLSALGSYEGSRPRIAAPSDWSIAYQVAYRVGQCLILLLLMKRSGKSMAEFGLTRPTGKHVGIGLGVGIVVFMTAPAYAWLIRGLNLSYRSAGIGDRVGYGAGLVAYALAGILFEELIFRCYLQTRLKEVGWRPGAIVAFTAALFTAPHIYQGFAALPMVFLFGLILGFMLFRFRSVWPGLVAHYLYDALAIGIAIVWSAAARHR